MPDWLNILGQEKLWVAVAGLVTLLAPLARFFGSSRANADVVRSGGERYPKYLVEVARAKADEIWIPLAKRLYELGERVETSTPYQRAEDYFHELRKIIWIPLFGAIVFLRRQRNRPRDAREENERLASDAEKVAADLFETGQHIRMPPSFVRRLRLLQQFIRQSRKSKGYRQEVRWSLRGQDPEASGFVTLVEDSSDPVLGKVVFFFLFLAHIYLWSAVLILSLGIVRMTTVPVAIDMNEDRFAVALRLRLRGIDESAQALLAGR